MASESIRELVVQDAVAALAAITGAGAYHHRLVTVTRGRAVADDVGDLPAGYLWEGDERITEATDLLIARELPLTVEIRLRSVDGDLPTQANRALADVERALLADPTRGGRAIRTTLESSTLLTDEPPGVLAAVRVTFLVLYRTRRGDPATLG